MGSSESDELGHIPNRNASLSVEIEPLASPGFDHTSASSPALEDPDAKASADILPRDQQQKTATYDYAYEKSMSHAEAKLFYQHHQLASKSGENTGPVSPVPSWRPMGDSHDDVQAMATEVSPRHKSHPAGKNSMVVESDWDLDSSTDQVTDGIIHGSQLADHSSQNHAGPSGITHGQGPHLSSGDNSHGTGLGIVSQGPGGDAITSELHAIYRKIKGLLDRRAKYLALSLQRPGDDPRDRQNWEIYPPPPEPAWDEGKEYQPGNVGGPADLNAKRRKMGQDIGEDFDMDELIPLPAESSWTYRLDSNSVYQVFESEAAADRHEPTVQIPSLRDFYMDLDAVVDVSSEGPAKSFAFKRLSYLEGKFQLYTLLNEYQEIADSKKVPHRDFYNVRKVDTHVHHSACMNQKHLLRFIKSKMRKSPDEVVLFRDGKHLTLREVFESINLTAYDLSIDTLDMHAHTDSFHRFDKFNLKYNPVGESRLREIFLKTDNYIKGRYLAEITKEVISDLESSKYQMVEWRISIYGRSADEWDKLAAWVVDNKLFSPNVRWLIQVPRLYDVYKSSGMMENFEQVIANVFQPLFEVTKDPSSHPKLHVFLQRVVGFDSVDDESKAERRLYRKYPIPRDWNTKQNPLIPTGSISCLLISPPSTTGDNSGVSIPLSFGPIVEKLAIQITSLLDSSAATVSAMIGIAMSPLSNNALFLTYDKNPCASFFKRGLNVSLSTDDPLQFAFTKEPLIEEYSVAAQIYKFSAVDMCELAKHSVIQSGFELSLKKRWLGSNCNLPGFAGNNVAKSNVPEIREAFRHETLQSELSLIARYSEGSVAEEQNVLAPGLLHTANQASAKPGPHVSP
ncbi:hypothetical protein N7494_010214 [Penicillium frequentans]|uniref:AMP deaminase n=1 Tax=Penicillium frequentans TaxID=3151616 RepID=A0AAD6CS40_9EURO|nr:hypothetical protein N7494_010214 [Penicillium glabrum]